MPRVYNVDRAVMYFVKLSFESKRRNSVSEELEIGVLVHAVSLLSLLPESTAILLNGTEHFSTHCKHIRYTAYSRVGDE